MSYQQPALFDDLQPTGRKRAPKVEPGPKVYPTFEQPAEFQLDQIPHLNGEKRIILNCETTGLKWWGGDRPIGWSYWLPESGRHGYLPIRHTAGNLPVERVHEWLGDLRHIHIDNHNTKFDLHMSRADGVDLVEDTGNTFGDSAHYAALLDDNRMRFSLDELSKDILGWDVETDGLGKQPSCIASEKEFQNLPSWVVAPYAVRNVEQVKRLIEAFTPQITAEELDEVLQLEQEVIPVGVEMEKNGVHLDLDLLHQWQRQAADELRDCLDFIYRETGIALDSPDSPKGLERLFKARGIPLTNFTEKGNPSFTAAVMKGVDDRCIQAAFKGGQLADLSSKYLDKYAKTVRSDGWIRFNLHQLKYIRGDDDSVGTVSGRFSAAGDKLSADMRPSNDGTGGFNPQQVVAVEKQLERGWCPDYVVRRLFKMNFAADMMQIEYRLFAHYANMTEAYHARPAFHRDSKGKIVWTAGPLADYHSVVAELLHKRNPTLNRKLVKNINFAKIYGAGLMKFALMVGCVTDAQYQDVKKMFLGRATVNDLLYRSPYGKEFRQALEITNTYDSMFPQVKPLLLRASKTADERGYVKDLVGRRARLLSRFHSALNRIIQGGAASINKRVLVEVYKLRKQLGLLMQLTVHDELAGTMADPRTIGNIKRVLNKQYFALKVPILWDAKTGANWAECK